MRRKKDIYEEYLEDSVEDVYQDTESFNNSFINSSIDFTYDDRQEMYAVLFEEAYRRDKQLLYSSLFKKIEDREKVKIYERLFKELEDADKQALYEELFMELDHAEQQAMYDELFKAVKETTKDESSSQLIQKKELKQPGKLKKFIRQNFLLFICLIIAAIVVLCASFLLVKGKTGISSGELSHEYMSRIREKAVVECELDYINNFFESYYDSLSSGNTTKLEEMYDDPIKANLNAQIANIVDHYTNIKCFVTPGITDNEMVVFVYNELVFANISATAPAVDCFYLKYDEKSQQMKITADMYTNEKKMKYMTLVSYKEPIRTLIEETNSAMFAALENNTDLRNLYVMMLSLSEGNDFLD